MGTRIKNVIDKYGDTITYRDAILDMISSNNGDVYKIFFVDVKNMRAFCILNMEVINNDNGIILNSKIFSPLKSNDVLTKVLYDEGPISFEQLLSLPIEICDTQEKFERMLIVIAKDCDRRIRCAACGSKVSPWYGLVRISKEDGSFHLRCTNCGSEDKYIKPSTNTILNELELKKIHDRIESERDDSE